MSCKDLLQSINQSYDFKRLEILQPKYKLFFWEKWSGWYSSSYDIEEIKSRYIPMSSLYLELSQTRTLQGVFECKPNAACREQFAAINVTRVCWLAGCLTSQRHADVSQGWICSDRCNVLPHWEKHSRSSFLSHPVIVYLNCAFCHSETEVADLFFSPSCSTLTPGQPVRALTLYRQVPGRVATECKFAGMSRPRKLPCTSGKIEPRAYHSRGKRLNHTAKEAVYVTHKVINISHG